jgi:hypothetical protein
MRSLRLPCVLAVSLFSCATLGGESNNGINLPSAGVGPFRPLKDGELALSAVVPYVFDDAAGAAGPEYREPSVVGSSDDPASAAVWMYAVATVGGAPVIVRTRADDARSFFADSTDKASSPQHAPQVVVSADQPWEGGTVAGPCAVRSGGQLWLFYGTAGGIALATSSDGLNGFTKKGVVLPVAVGTAGSSWETTPPRAPGVSVFPDGTWHMLYAAGASIGEATSPDGVTWTRSGADPVLRPSDPVDPSTLPEGVKPPFDEGSVDDPVLAPQTTVDGRFQVRVLYTGYREPPGGTAQRDSAIGLAGRWETDGPLSKQALPVYTAQLHETAPAFFEYAGRSLLYVGEDDTSLDPTKPFPGIAAAYSPASDTLPPPLPFPTSP